MPAQSKTLRSLGWIWMIMTLRPWSLALMSSMFLAAALCDIISPRLVKNFLSTLETNAPTHDIFMAGALMVGVGWASFYVFQYFGYRINCYFQTYGMGEIYKRLYDRVQYAPYAWHGNELMGATVVKITRSVRAYELFTDRLYLTGGLVIAVLVSIGSIALLGFSYPVIALALGACFFTGTGVLIYLTLFFSAPANRAANNEESKVGGSLADRLIGNYAVKSFAAEKRERDVLSGVVGRWREVEYKSWFRNVDAGFLYEWSLVAAIVIGMSFCVSYTKAGIMPLSDVAMVFFTIMLINTYTRQLGRIVLDMQKALNDIEDGVMLDNLAAEPSGDLPAPEIKRALTFTDVKFRYGDGSRAVLDIPYLEVPKGQKLGLLGHSGAGKSTLVSLLMRFYDASEGVIAIDGQPLTQTDLRSLRRSIAVIPQDTILFHQSLYDNIRYGRPDASEADILEAAVKAHAHEFIETLPQGYHTMVGERGVKLSGGQRQRVSIARAILKNAPILILDEATSALDTESEQLIQESLKTLMEDKTVIAIAHRLSTIHRLDRLIVLEEGKIIEDGSHDQLLRKKGVYKRLWEMQSGGFLQE